MFPTVCSTQILRIAGCNADSASFTSSCGVNRSNRVPLVNKIRWKLGITRSRSCNANRDYGYRFHVSPWASTVLTSFPSRFEKPHSRVYRWICWNSLVDDVEVPEAFTISSKISPVGFCSWYISTYNANERTEWSISLFTFNASEYLRYQCCR